MKTIVTVLLLILGLTLWAQEDKTPKSKFEFYWQSSAMNIGFAGNVYNAILQEIPNSSILQTNGKEIEQGRSYLSNGISTPLSFGIGLPVNLLKTDKVSTTWRIGADFMGSISIGGLKINEIFKRLDSTYFPTYNTSLMKDSVFYQTVGGSVQGKFAQVKTDVLVRFRPEKRFTFFTGIGLGMGITHSRSSVITDKSEEGERITSSLETSSNPNESYHNNAQNQYTLTSFKEEKFELKTVLSPVAYIPYGMDWQIGKKSNFAKRLHIYYEGQMGARFVDAFLGTTQSNFYVSNALGVRVKI